MSRPRCLRCGATSEWIEGKAPNEPAEGSFAAPTGLAALVEQWKGEAAKLRAEQKGWEYRGWHTQGPGTDCKLKAEILEKCIEELEAANAGDERRT